MKNIDRFIDIQPPMQPSPPKRLRKDAGSFKAGSVEDGGSNNASLVIGDAFEAYAFACVATPEEEVLARRCDLELDVYRNLSAFTSHSRK